MTQIRIFATQNYELYSNTVKRIEYSIRLRLESSTKLLLMYEMCHTLQILYLNRVILIPGYSFVIAFQLR